MRSFEEPDRGKKRMRRKRPIRGGERYLWKRWFEARGQKRRGFGQRNTVSEAEKESGKVPEEMQFVTIFLWTLILNISGHLETLKFCCS